jgi:hypothetical protein
MPQLIRLTNVAFSQWHWRLNSKGNATRHKIRDGKKAITRMHRMIWLKGAGQYNQLLLLYWSPPR